ncbi:MAG: amidoligase family protein, partial [Lachnospirales bacterium]
RFCSKVDDDFVKKMNGSRRLTLEDIKKEWYSNYRNPDAEANRHYSETRYKGLNLHSVFYKGTLEFRIYVQKNIMYSYFIKPSNKALFYKINCT